MHTEVLDHERVLVALDISMVCRESCTWHGKA